MTLDEFSNLLEGIGALIGGLATVAIAIGGFVAFNSWRTEHAGKERYETAENLIRIYSELVKEVLHQYDRRQDEKYISNTDLSRIWRREKILDDLEPVAILHWEILENDIQRFRPLVSAFARSTHTDEKFTSVECTELEDLGIKICSFLVKEVKSTRFIDWWEEQKKQAGIQ